MQNEINRLDVAFVTAAAATLDLIRRDEVRDQWLLPSVLPKMSSGALACHLGRQVSRAAELLPMAADTSPLDCVDKHYEQAAWVKSTSPDDPPNDRSTDNAENDQTLRPALTCDNRGPEVTASTPGSPGLMARRSCSLPVLTPRPQQPRMRAGSGDRRLA